MNERSGISDPRFFAAFNASVQRCCVREGQQPLKLHFYPDLPNVGSAFFPWKEMIVKKTCGAIKIPGFRQIQYQFKHQGIGSVGKASDISRAPPRARPRDVQAG